MVRQSSLGNLTETTDRTVSAWEKLAEKDLLPEKMRTTLGDPFLSVAKTVAQVTRNSLIRYSSTIHAVAPAAL
jgi:hypothetical protein